MVELYAREVGRTHAFLPAEGGGEITREFTLYVTPDGERWIYDQGTLVTGPVTVQPGQPPSEVRELESDLYPLEKASEKDAAARESAEFFEETT